MRDDWFEVAPCGLLRTADDGTILRVNRTFCTWVGRTPEELAGLRFQDLLTMGGRIFHQTHWAPLMRIQGSVSEVKLEIVHRDGSKIPMVVNAVRHEIEGETRHDLAAFVARDRDRYEQELVKSRKRLEELVAETRRLHDEAKDRALFAEQMVGIVSHDLRNPLSVVAMGAALLEEGATKTQLRVVHRIQRSTTRAAQLISDLLDFTAARVGSGITVAPAPFDLHAFVADSLEDLRFANPGHAIVHQREGDSACVADEQRVAQVLGNLVSNATAYGRPDREISVTTRGGKHPAVIVHNWGPPIPPEKVPALFEPMTRGERAPGKSGSVGLGLYIVQEIARAHGGAAWAISTEESGTTFTVAFARAEQDA